MLERSLPARRIDSITFLLSALGYLLQAHRPVFQERSFCWMQAPLQERGRFISFSRVSTRWFPGGPLWDMTDAPEPRDSCVREAFPGVVRLTRAANSVRFLRSGASSSLP